MASIVMTLLHKNSLMIRHHAGKYLLVYLSPFLVLLVMMAMQAAITDSFTWVNADPQATAMKSIPRCKGDGCLTIGYLVAGPREPYVDAVINNIIQNNNQLSAQDVKYLDIPPTQVSDYISTHHNQTQAIILFCTSGSLQVGHNVSVPCTASHYHLNFYTIFYNLTLFHKVPYFSGLNMPYPKDQVTIKLKTDIDQAIIGHYTQSKLNLLMTNFPAETSRFVAGFSVASQYGSFFITIPYLILLVLTSTHLLLQKQKKLRIGLNIVGVSHFQFYAAELLTYFTSVVIISINFTIGGLLFGFTFWTNGFLVFNFLLMVSNGMVLGLIGFCVTALVSQKNLGMSIVYGFTLYSVIMQWLFTGGFVLELLYINTAPAAVVALKYIFNAYPSFHFSKVFTDISRIASTHMDTYENRFVQGRQILLEDLFTRAKQEYLKPFPHSYELPSPIESLINILLTSLLYFSLLLFLDWFVESNRGFRKPLFQSRKRKLSQYDSADSDQAKKIIRITNLQKMYANQVHALKGVSLSIKEGEIVSLLGENGAGKSTLINILIGSLAMDGGEVLVDGMNVCDSIIEIRKRVGICPQFDILWDELTAGQHIDFFMKLKGLEVREGDVDRQLEAVSLRPNRNGKVAIFSGGMRRRLSLAISLIGNPCLVILDEPTTGMDAQIRLATWKLILKLKEKCTILLTTHNMEEAQCVSDLVLIMSRGRLVAEGDLMQLKKQHGCGYMVHGYDPEKKQDVAIKCSEQDLERTLEEVIDSKIENWSLREATLEEVFLNVNSKY